MMSGSWLPLIGDVSPDLDNTARWEGCCGKIKLSCTIDVASANGLRGAACVQYKKQFLDSGWAARDAAELLQCQVQIWAVATCE